MSKKIAWGEKTNETAERIWRTRRSKKEEGWKACFIFHPRTFVEGVVARERGIMRLIA